MSDIPDNAPAPRLCIIAKWPEFEGYGFNLHAEKSKPGQFIGKVDPGSPAEYAGLLEGDRIIEVNDVNIANENHKQVVQRIKMVQNETRLLVLDPKADKYYKSKNIVVRGTQSNVIVKSSVRDHKVIVEEDEDDDDNAPALPSTPEPVSSSAPVTNGHNNHHHHHDDVDTRSVSSAASSSATSEASTQPQPVDAAGSHDDDSAPEAVVMKSTEALRNRSPSPLPEEGDDNSSQEGDIKPPEEHVHAQDDDQPSQNADVKPQEEEEEVVVVRPPLEDTSSYEGDATPSESEIASEEGNITETNKTVEAEAASEAAPSSPDPESDLEAEYDNVLLGSGKGGAEVEAAPPSYTSRRSSASSSAGSHSPRGSDAAHTDTTQSPMSTSPTPPPSLEPAPAPAPAPAPTTTTTKPAPQPVSKNNAYNSSGLNLNMSAAEMRAKLARKKKTDPRNDTLDLRKKYEIIQNM